MTYLGGSVALLATDRNTWHSRADNSWGSSRVWNTGSSFETDLANMTTDRNNWQSSSNTWQGRANNAWGNSRTWNSGESFEAAYNRVNPTNAPTSNIWACLVGNYPGPGGSVAMPVSGQTTIPRTGVYMLIFSRVAQRSGSASIGDASYQILVGGVAQVSVGAGTSNYATGTYTAGQTVGLNMNMSGGWNPNDTGGTLWLIFNPTTTYPR